MNEYLEFAKKLAQETGGKVLEIVKQGKLN